MLSPGEWHRLVPKDRAGNLRFRRRLLAACARSAALRADVLAVCRLDILFYVNSFVFQFNPKKKQGGRQIGPFVTWPFQDAALLDRPETTGHKGMLWCYEQDKSMVVQKSREMGMSWLFLILQDWLGLFHPHVQALAISKSADAVDSKSPDSLFWKLRFMHQWLPGWLRGPVVEEKMYVEYARTGSVATGEASTGRAGVGGRAGVIFVDEFPQIKEAQEVRERTANTSDCRFFNGTHLGAGTEFARLCDPRQTPEFARLTVHWTSHPDKNEKLYRWDRAANVPESLRYDAAARAVVPAAAPHAFPPDFAFVSDGTPTGGPFPGVRSPWYDAKCRDIGDARAVAMDLDIDPQGAASQFFDAILIHELKHTTAREPVWVGRLLYDRETGEPDRLEADPTGPVKLWLHPTPRGGVPAGKYTVGADPSYGTGATPSCATVVNGRTGEKVLEYAEAAIQPDRFGVLLVAVAKLFADAAGTGAHLGWECPGPGLTVGNAVVATGYRNVYFRRDEFKVFGSVSDKPGWYQSNDGKKALLTEYKAALRDRRFVNPSREALDECLGFEWLPGGQSVAHATEYKTRDPSGAGANHGDRVIADALAWFLAKDLGTGKQPARPRADDVPYGSLAWRRQEREARTRDEEQYA